MTAEYRDGLVVALFVMAFVYLPASLVPIYRPSWADKLLGPMLRVTPQRGKLIGAFMLLGFALQVGDIVRQLMAAK